MNEQKIFFALEQLNIPYKNHIHEPVFTVEEAQKLYDSIPGGQTKNLFITDKRGNYLLVVMLSEDRLDLSLFRKQLAMKNLTFATSEELQQLLGVTPGSVTALGVINDTQHKVTVYLDQDLAKHDMVNCHPLRNDMTVTIATEDLLHFLKSTGHEPIITEFPKR